MSSEYVEFTDEEWPMCAIPGCRNRCCLSLHSIYCWPHTGGGKSYQGMMDKLKQIKQPENAQTKTLCLE